MKKFTTILSAFVLATFTAFAQNDSVFFPTFQAYPSNPIIKYGDGFADAAWNDPCVLKINNQYIMYISAATGIMGTDVVKIYRMVSTDGYSWSLSPSTPVLQPVNGTYYEGGTETPSVVYYNNQYHLYTTSYPVNNASDFVIAHATSADGINWQMDATPILESDNSATFYGNTVGEPGAIVYHDSIYLFFTAYDGATSQSIGLIRSSDGTTFDTPTQTATLPTDVYPTTDGWFGLSTPSALAINDSIYLFTDVARIINGEWTQAALHQFKSYGTNFNHWYHSATPIYTMQDFSWTNGNYLSEIRSINAIMDDNNRLRIWYAGNHIGDISNTNDTTYNVTVDSAGIHVMPNFWGIGTSEYQFNNLTLSVNLLEQQKQITLYPNPADATLYIKGITDNDWKIINTLGEVISVTQSGNSIDTRQLPCGTYCILFNNGKEHKKFVVSH